MSESTLGRARESADRASAAAHAAAQNLNDTGADIDEAADADVPFADEAERPAEQEEAPLDQPGGDIAGPGSPMP
ncbi:hypothetical protein [Georgenia sp. SYP-B2076]|uniref:hypothetical protein n=1 Tax=Georgenia sp. SYP-B2076 TaxID=2495881 RepID=UPI000F8CA5BB|nr:hypothetical protein [Georgenia sp. SYP-B2076]